MSTVARGTVRRPLFAIVVVAVGLMVARAVWPKLVFDTTSLVLFAIAAAAWAMAYLPISKFKAGDYEIELVQTVGELQRKVSQIETADRVTAELEQKVIAVEATATARTERVPEEGEAKVMRRDPAARVPSAYVEEYRRIVESRAPDDERIMRAVELLVRMNQAGRLPSGAAGIVEGMRQMGTNILARGDATPRVTSSVLELVWRLIRLEPHGG